MRIYKAKLKKMGYSDEDAMKIMEMDEVKFKKVANRSAFDIGYIPEKFELASQGRDINLFKFIKLYDDIFKINGLEINTNDIDFKIDAIKNFPSLLREIELSKINSEIKALEVEKEKMLKALSDIEANIKTKKMEFDSSKMQTKPVVETPVEETKTQKEEKTFVVGEHVGIMTIRKNGNGQFRIKKELLEDIEVGDILKIANEQGIKKYRITATSKGIKSKINYICASYLETVFTNAS